MYFHDTNPTKCTNLFLSYLYYNIAVSIPECFGPQRTIIRESNQRNIVSKQLDCVLCFFGLVPS